MKINREDVLRVAQLAHLELNESELEMYRGQLDAILTYVDKLNELDVSGVEPMAQILAATTSGATSAAAESPNHPPAGSPIPSNRSSDAEDRENSALRADLERPMHTAEAVLKIAPDPVAPYFRVPKVIER